MRLLGALAVPVLLVASGVPVLPVPPLTSDDVDRYFEATWRDSELPPAPPTSDATFLRRLWVDLAGTIPPADDVAAFLGRPDRAAAIDSLLASDLFSDHWAGLLFDHWIGRPEDYELFLGRDGFFSWLRDSIAAGRPYDEIVFDVLSAEGRMSDSPQAHFLFRWNGVAAQMAAASRAFLGTPIRCAQCHDHPFEPIAREDYWSLAAYFSTSMWEYAPAGFYEKQGARTDVILTEMPGTIDIPSDDRPLMLEPRIPDALADAPPPRDMDWTRRKSFARWATDAGNLYFSRGLVNWVWARLFTRGIFHPVDAWGDSHPPAHPELLDSLARGFARDFDLRRLLRLILNTRTYQRSGREGADVHDPPAAFAAMAPRDLDGTELIRSISQALGRTGLKVEEGVSGADRYRAAFERAFAGNRSPVGRIIGRMTGPMRDRPTSRVWPLMGDPDERITRAFLTTLSRPPREDEREFFRAHLQRVPGLEGIDDILWTLLNSAEFGQRR